MHVWFDVWERLVPPLYRVIAVAAGSAGTAAATVWLTPVPWWLAIPLPLVAWVGLAVAQERDDRVRSATPVPFDDDDDSSPLEAYGTVTNPERFLAVQAAARDLVDRLADRFVVRVEPGSAADDFPRDRVSGVVLRVTPEDGEAGSLAVLFTDHPGVFVRTGRWSVEAFPHCGCDACDEQPDDLIQDMERFVEGYVTGGQVETLTRRALRLEQPDGSSTLTLRGDDWKSYGQLGTTHWSAWTERQDAPAVS